MPRRKLARFLLAFAVALAALSVVLPWLTKPYAWLVLQVVKPDPAVATASLSGLVIHVSAPRVAGLQPFSATLHSLVFTYGLAVAVALTVAMPGLSTLRRTVLILAILLLSFVAHLIGLHFFISRAVAVAGFKATPDDLGRLASVLSLLWFVLPSLVWLPAFLRQRRAWQREATAGGDARPAQAKGRA